MAGTVMALSHKHDPAVFTARVNDRDAMIAAATSAVARLTEIVANIDSYTTAQLKTALQDIAQYERSLIRIVARSV